MAKFICCLLSLAWLICPNVGQVSSDSDDLKADLELRNECIKQLNVFAERTSDFTKCVISNAQPIKVCENCAMNYTRVVVSYQDIQKINASDKENCRDTLTNIDRLQVVRASYNYVESMWKDASCKLCLNGTDLNEHTKEMQDLNRTLENCLSYYPELNSTSCAKCEPSYLDLTNYYDRYKNTDGFCMDIVDLVNKTQLNWGKKCHNYNGNTQWLLLIISFIALLMPILFYLINWLSSHGGSYALLSQNRYRSESLTNNIVSTSGYVVIS